MTTTTTSSRNGVVTVALAAMLALAAEVLLAYLVFAGAPNPGMAAVAVLPLGVAVALWRGKRWALVIAALVAVLVVGLRTLPLSFDLARPGDPAPFLFTVVTLLTAGLAVSSALAGLAGSGRTVVAGGGALLAAATGAGLLLLSPQADDTGSLTDEQVAALPTVEMINFSYTPAQLRVDPGQPVAFRFTNDTDDTHTFTIDELDVDVQVPSGRSRVAVVEAAAGEYGFWCSAGSHREDGMEGRLVVVEGAGTVDSTAHGHGDHGAHGHSHG